MEIGSKLCKLRKTANLSQEQLAEKINVTRQTISNWELGQTVPDIMQAKEISKIFKITLDELVDNDVKDILVEKISNTEKMTNTIIKTIKYLSIAIIFFLIIIISINVILLVSNKNEDIKEQTQRQMQEQEYQKYRENLITRQFICTINEQTYEYSIKYDASNTPVTFWLSSISEEPDEILFYNLYNYLYKKYENYTDALELIRDLEQYFKDNNGKWEENS